MPLVTCCFSWPGSHVRSPLLKTVFYLEEKSQRKEKKVSTFVGTGEGRFDFHPGLVMAGCLFWALPVALAVADLLGAFGLWGPQKSRHTDGLPRQLTNNSKLRKKVYIASLVYLRIFS